jgi:hypothetical protein
MEDFKVIKTLLPESGKAFPTGKGVNTICGKTFARTNKWWKAILLIKSKFGKNEKYQLRLYGWQKNKQGVYKNRQKFNISASRYVGDLIAILHVFIAESGKGDVLEEIDEKLISRIDILQREKNRLEKQKSRTPELERNLAEFKKLLKNDKTTEPDIHKFLKNNTWMFGTNYTRMFKSEKLITIKNRNDFLLQKFDRYYDILDLKSPKFPLFVKIRGKKKAISKELKDSISQVMVYLADARTYYLTIREETGIDLYFPEGIIIIGRRKEEDKALLKIHNEFLNKIRIWTYDDLLDTAEKTIEHYKSKVG